MAVLGAESVAEGWRQAHDENRVLGVGVRRRRVGNVDIVRVCVRYAWRTDWFDVGLHGRVMDYGRIVFARVG